MNLNSAIGVVSSIALLAPILLIVILRLYTNRSFLALAVYFLIESVQNLMRQNIIQTSRSLSQTLGILDNLLDAPLMLIFLTFFSISVVMTKRITITLLAILAFEAIVVAVFGFTVETVKIVLGPDILVISALSFIFFLRNVRLAITNSKALGKAIMISSVLLYYSIFTLVYIFYYLARNLRYHEDAQLIYYLVTLLSALLMAAGILIEKNRIRQLDELKHTRRELASIYGKPNRPALNEEGRFFGN